MNPSSRPRRLLTARSIRETISPSQRERSSVAGLALFFANLALYLGSLAGLLLCPDVRIQFLLVLVDGVSIGTLFLVAHDACHGSLTPSERLNAWVARVAFLPSLHPYSSWELGHNRLHHNMTNLRGTDYVWTPLSLAEYRRLGPFGRALQRFYRSLPGLGPYHFVEIWLKHMMFPGRHERRRVTNSRVLNLDHALTLAYLVGLPLALLALDGFLAAGTGRAPSNPWALLARAVVLPAVVWNYLIGFLTYFQHTHPRTVWYAHRDEWDFYRGQLRDTVHIRLPSWLRWMFLNIMEHTAHHVDPKIPLYHLAKSQRQLADTFGEVIEESWQPWGFLRTLRVCQLYDYENHRWLDFAGRPTTEVLAAEPTHGGAPARRETAVH